MGPRDWAMIHGGKTKIPLTSSNPVNVDGIVAVDNLGNQPHTPAPFLAATRDVRGWAGMSHFPGSI